MPRARLSVAWTTLAVCLAAACLAGTADEPNLTEDQIRQFLVQAKIIRWRRTSKGITTPWRLTLTDGMLTHDACFQSIDETQKIATLASGRSEFNFRDSYHFNIAAFELAKLLGLGGMIPVTVERKWQGNPGSLTWWMPAKQDEQEHLQQKLQPPTSMPGTCR